MAVFTEQTISFLISLLLVSVQGKAISRFLMFQLLTRFTEIASPPLPIAPYSYSPGVIPVAVIASPPIFALVTQPVVLVSRVERDSFYLSHRPTVPQASAAACCCRRVFNVFSLPLLCVFSAVHVPHHVIAVRRDVPPCPRSL